MRSHGIDHFALRLLTGLGTQAVTRICAGSEELYRDARVAFLSFAEGLLGPPIASRGAPCVAAGDDRDDQPPSRVLAQPEGR